MVKYKPTPFTVTPDYTEYNCFVDVYPIAEKITADNLLWPVSDELLTVSKSPGNIHVIELNGNVYIALFVAFKNIAGNRHAYKKDDKWYVDSDKSRFEYFKSTLEKILLLEKANELVIVSNTLLAQDYKSTQEKHLSNISYFYKNVAKYIPISLDWTVIYKEPRRFKSINNKDILKKENYDFI